MSFMQKASYGVGAALAELLLDLISYQAHKPRSQLTLDALKVVMILLPAELILVAFLIIGRYQLGDEKH